MKTYPNANAFHANNENGIPVGLTKREYIAALALQGILSNRSLVVVDVQSWQWSAEVAVLAADELINALNKSDENSTTVK